MFHPIFTEEKHNFRVENLADYIVLKSLKYIETHDQFTSNYLVFLPKRQMIFISYICCLLLDENIDLFQIEKLEFNNSLVLHCKAIEVRYPILQDMISLPNENSDFFPYFSPKVIKKIEEYPEYYHKLDKVIDYLLELRYTELQQFNFFEIDILRIQFEKPSTALKNKLFYLKVLLENENSSQ